MVWMLTSFGVGCGITWVVAGVGSSGPYPTWDLKAPGDAGCDVTENEDGSISVKVPVGGIEMKADG